MAQNNNFSDLDKKFMLQAYQQAEQAAKLKEVPVGAIVVVDGLVIGSGFNQPISTNDPSAHAEMVAMRNAAAQQGNYRIVDATLYVTLEPCAMCAGAMLHARIKRLVFAASDPKAGAIGGAMDLFAAHKWNHSVQCEGGLLAESCGALLRQFFQERR
jgi:tRNA(adenine34) deaminase